MNKGNGENEIIEMKWIDEVKKGENWIIDGGKKGNNKEVESGD